MARTSALLLFLFILSATAFAQHDPGRNAVRLLVQGKTEEAAKAVAKEVNRMNRLVSVSFILFRSQSLCLGASVRE